MSFYYLILLPTFKLNIFIIVTALTKVIQKTFDTDGLCRYTYVPNINIFSNIICNFTLIQWTIKFTGHWSSNIIFGRRKFFISIDSYLSFIMCALICHTFIYHLIFMIFHLSIYISVCLSIYSSIYLSICLFKPLFKLIVWRRAIDQGFLKDR